MLVGQFALPSIFEPETLPFKKPKPFLDFFPNLFNKSEKNLYGSAGLSNGFTETIFNK
jgi:hypothetical protein